MCTVTYVPLTHGFIITSSRDEDMMRPRAIPPKVYHEAQLSLLLPRDPQGGGSWIGVSSQGRVACLLNGAREKHQHKPPYRKSRGLVLLDSLRSDDVHQFLHSYELDGIEPFTLIIANCLNPPVELIWDGQRRQVTLQRKNEPRLWSSVTLYPAAVHEQKVKEFTAYVAEQSSLHASTLFALHCSFVYEERVPYAEQVAQVRTLSITSVVANEWASTMWYWERLPEEKTFVAPRQTTLLYLTGVSQW